MTERQLEGLTTHKSKEDFMWMAVMVFAAFWLGYAISSARSIRGMEFAGQQTKQKEFYWIADGLQVPVKTTVEPRSSSTISVQK